MNRLNSFNQTYFAPVLNSPRPTYTSLGGAWSEIACVSLRGAVQRASEYAETRMAATTLVTPKTQLRLDRQARARQMRCAFTGRFKAKNVPVTHGPAWAIALDAEVSS